MRVQRRLRPDAVLAALSRFARAVGRAVGGYFVGREPRVRAALWPALVVAVVLFVRTPLTNFIFDEQEALLANPYVNGSELGYWQAFSRDFWGLPPERTIGSYRPLPNLLWRGIWHLGRTPFFAHSLNVLLHGLNAALLGALVFRLTRERLWAWLAGAAFVTTALLTEAVSGVVGIADVLVGTALLGCLWALQAPLLLQAPLVGAGLLLGLLCKESCIVGLVLLPWSAWMLSPLLVSERPRRVLRVLLLAFAGALALVAYTYLRRHFFPLGPAGALDLQGLPSTGIRGALGAFLRWFQQPRLPSDVINNPLVNADTAQRIAAALRIYASGLLQAIVPWRLSGDYSFAQEVVPERLVSVGSVSGGLLMLALPAAALVASFSARFTSTPERRLLIWGALWIPAAYFPLSNLLVLLPTVRAERLWYVPVLGTAVLLGWFWSRVVARGRSGLTLFGKHFDRKWVLALALGFFALQAVQARVHATHFSNDLWFWRATVRASPDSAKAHLNYGVMLGARGNLQGRLTQTARALELAPKWPMASVYYADTLCRLKRVDEAWPHYRRGFELGPREANLIALGLQCLWEAGRVRKLRPELTEMAARNKGSWLDFLVRDIFDHGEENDGVTPTYRPRSYNGGPRNAKTASARTADTSRTKR